MRITNKFLYAQNINRYQAIQADVNRANNKHVDDRKFHQGYDDSSSYSESLRLDNEIESLKRVYEAADKAVSITKNSDNAVSEISKSLDLFKVKLVQAANEVHSSTSLNAIANDLQEIRNHIVNIANTSINGQFLFSGTAINIKPFDDKGNYHGNTESMKVLLGSQVHQSYNVSGADLFVGKDSDYHKVISSNIRMLDHRYDVRHPDEVHYLTPQSKIRDLVGKNYALKGEEDSLSVVDNFFGHESFPPTYFYVSGTRGDGQSFRAKFSMQNDENIEQMLRHIGKLYGNTDDNELVKVELSKSGTIEITDLANDNSRLNFSMFAATKRSNKLELFPKEAQKAAEENEKLLAEYEKLNQEALDKVTQEALDQGFAPGMPDFDQFIQDNIQRPELPTLNILPNATGKNIADVDNLAALKELEVDGSVHIIGFCNNANLTPEGDESEINYARTQFNVEGKFLTSNIIQREKSGAIATDASRIIDCASAPLETDENEPHTVLNAKITSRGGKNYDIKIDLTACCVEWFEPGEDPAVPPVNPNVPPNHEPFVPLEPAKVHRQIDFTQLEYNQRTHENYRRKSHPEEITFAQINGIIELFASDNVPDTDIIADTPMPATQGDGVQLNDEDFNRFNELLSSAKSQLSVHLKDGKLTLEDETTTATNVRLAIYDAICDGDEFALEPNQVSQRGDVLCFASNSSIVIDEQQLDVIKDLDKMIAAVRSGEYRSDVQNTSKKKNPGIQAAIRRLDHIADHLRKVHTKIGSVQTAIENARDRSEVMSLNITEVKNKVLGATPDDKAKAFLELTTLMNNFQAVLQTSAMINKISLLDYMR